MILEEEDTIRKSEEGTARTAARVVNKMNVLVVGGGGREHAILRKLSESPRAPRLFAAPGNGGIAAIAECLPVKATDTEGILEAAKRNAIDLVFVAPDDPLMLGMVDLLEANGIRAFGPRKNAAIIEGSKAFSKALMKEHGIPTAAYEIFESAGAAITYLSQNRRYPIVIKADGLALGKGVIIAQSYAEACAAVHQLMEDKAFGAAGDKIVIEDYLEGPEVTVLAFCDGKTVRPMVSSQDHKRALDNDEGLNTGGMGTIAPSPYYSDKIADLCMETIFQPTVDALRAEGRPFKGVLYFGLMLCSDGPYVIEYNARFGDPEAQVVLPLLKTDLLDIIDAVIDERLDEISIEWEDSAAACIVMASGGYPQKYSTGFEITGLDALGKEITVYHAGTKFADGKYLTAGGRVLGVCAKGAELSEALEKAYRAIDTIDFCGRHFRKDIGQKALKGR